MRESHWQEIDQVVGVLLELPAAERGVRLLQMTLTPEVRKRVESLLQAWNDSEDFLETPILSFAEAAPERMIGRRFGVWHLLSVIGCGGMGTVYLAERDDRQFTQRAAVKLIAGYGMNPSAERRFLEERQILARLEHPHVARLIDGGIHVDGSPYLAMEYIEGTAIHDWCAERNLPVAARLELFRQVCAAVQFAHQNLVVHCDLKPANILVTRDGCAKLLDFGIARIIGPREETTATQPRRMTLDYASPEQVRGVAITTASDIYSLGVLLHELLTGRRPYQLEGKPLEEVLAIVCDREVAKPGAGSADLDAVILKGLRKEPGQRYLSAAEMSADVQRYLAGRPVEARPPTAAYVFRRFAARHRLAMAMVAALVLLAVIASAVIARESRIASRRFNSVRRLAHFVIFEMHDAIAPLGGSTPARKLLVAQGMQYLDELAGDRPRDPDLQLELATAYIRLGDVSGLNSDANLGDVTGALGSYRKALHLLEPLSQRNPQDPAVRDALALAWQHMVQVLQDRDPAAAMAIAEQLVGLQRKRTGAHADDEALAALATAYGTRAGVADELGRYDQALRDGLYAMDIWEGLLAKSPADPTRQRNAALGHKYTAGRLLAQGGDLAQTEQHLQRAEELDQKLLEARPSDREAGMDLSFDLSQDGFFQWHRRKNLPKARALFERALRIREELARSDPSDARLRGRISYLRFNLGVMALESGNPSDALVHADMAVRIDREFYLRDGTPANRRRLAEALQLAGRADEAVGRHGSACGAWENSRQLVAEGIRSGQTDSDGRAWLADLTGRLKSCGR